MQPYIRGGVLELFPGTVEALGGDTKALLREADVAPEVLTIPGLYLPYASYMKLMHGAACSTGCDHFGLEMSRAGNAETLGTVGIIMTQADTVGSAWETLAHFYSIHDTYGRVSVERGEDYALVRYALPRNDLPGTRQVYDVAAGIMDNIMRQFCGADYRAREVACPYPQPEQLAPYDHLSVNKLRFNANAMETVFDPGLLDKPLPGRSPELHMLLDDYLASQNSGGQVSTSAMVEDMIRRLLPTGDCTLVRVADTLAITVRTLQSRLDSEKNSFRQLLENVRREIATYHLRRGDMPLTQLAMVLGYSELSAFSRSFRNWYGVSPRQWAERGDWRA